VVLLVYINSKNILQIIDMKAQIPKDTVFAYFGGNATALQKKLIAEWLLEPGNSEVYFEWLSEWETSRPQFIPDATSAFEKFSNRIQETAPVGVEYALPGRLNIGFQIQWKWVAAFLLSMGIAMFSMKEKIINKTYATAHNDNQTIILEDQSKVVLTSDSRLHVPRWGFGKYRREVILEGEATFSVTHTIENKPFVVTTPDRSTVTVLGTEFAVYARSKGTQVVLNKGKVQLATLNDPKPREMSPGDKATVTATGHVEIKKLTETELAIPGRWKEHQFDFQHTTLGNATKEINEVFGVHIVVVDKSLSDRELSGTFRAKDANELLNVLSEMLDMRVTLNENSIYLTPKF
jgi:transmembrane sensor